MVASTRKRCSSEINEIHKTGRPAAPSFRRDIPRVRGERGAIVLRSTRGLDGGGVTGSRATSDVIRLAVEGEKGTVNGES